MVASGTFDVDRAPLQSEAPLQRYSLKKQFNGGLVGRGEGAMLAWHGEGNGSAAYVALEQVTGSLKGAEGSFVLAHYGTMMGDMQELMLTVVPGSGSEELLGLEGSMTIRIDEGVHHYEFQYILPATAR